MLAGCSGAPAPISAADYYDLVRDSEIFTPSTTQQELDEYADDVCKVMRVGDVETSWVYGVKYLTDAGMSGGDSGTFLAQATSYKCPEMVERFPG